MNGIDLRQIAHIVGILVLIALVLPFVVFAVPGLVGADGSYVVLSGSMEPTISPGDVVFVQATDTATIEEGTVITYHREGQEIPTTHRVVEVTEENGTTAFVTQGDAVAQPDSSTVPATQVIGTVGFTIPYIGHVIQFVNTPTGFVALVVIPFTLLLVSEVLSYYGIQLRSTKDAETSTDETGIENTEATSSPSSSAAGTDSDTSNEETITLSRSDLQLSIVVLVFVAGYAGWVAYNVQETWSFIALFAAGISTLLVGGMYATSSKEPGDGHTEPEQSERTMTKENSHGRADAVAFPHVFHENAAIPSERLWHAQNGQELLSTRRIVEGSLPEQHDDLPHIEVDVMGKLIEMAEIDRDWIIFDGDTNQYYVLRSTAIFYFDGKGTGNLLASTLEDSNLPHQGTSNPQTKVTQEESRSEDSAEHPGEQNAS